MRRSNTTKLDKNRIGRALLKENNTPAVKREVNSKHSDLAVNKRSKTMPCEVASNDKNAAPVTDEDLIRRLNDSDGDFFKRYYASLLARYTGQEDSILMALAMNARKITNNDELSRGAINLIFEKIPSDSPRASFFLSALRIVSEELNANLVKRALNEKFFHIMSTLFQIDPQFTVKCLVELTEQRAKDLKFWSLVSQHLRSVPALADSPLAKHVFARHLTMDRAGIAAALCFGENRRKALDGFYWLTEKLEQSIACSREHVRRLPKWLARLTSEQWTIEAIEGDIDEIVSALPCQSHKFIVYVLNSVRKKSWWKKGSHDADSDRLCQFLLRIVRTLLPVEDILSDLVASAFRPCSRSATLLSKVLMDRRCVTLPKARSTLEEKLLPRFGQLHTLLNPSELVSCLSEFLRSSCKARFAFFQNLLVYSENEATVQIAMDGVLMLLSNDRLAVATILAKCTSQASQLVSMSQPASQRHLVVCATSLNLLRKNFASVQDKVHLLLRKNRPAVAAPLLSMLVDAVLAADKNSDRKALFECCLRCLAECIDNLGCEANRDDIIYFGRRLIKALAVELESKQERPEFVSVAVELQVLAGKLGMAENAPRNVPKDQSFIRLVSKVAAMRFLDEIDAYTGAYDLSLVKKTVLGNTKCNDWNRDFSERALERLQQPECEDMKWWLRVAAECQVHPPPDEITEIKEVDVEALRWALQWAAAKWKDLDPAVWLPWAESAISRITTDGEYKTINRKMLDDALMLYCNLSDNPFPFILQCATDHKEDRAVFEALARCTEKQVQCALDSRHLIRHLVDEHWVALLRPLSRVACNLARYNASTTSSCQKTAIVLSQLYELVSALLDSGETKLKLLKEVLHCLGKDGLQKACSEFISVAQSLDNDFAGKKKSKQSCLTNAIPRLVHSADKFESLVINTLDDIDLVKKYFKLNACRDFRISKSQFEIVKEKLAHEPNLNCAASQVRLI